MVTYARGADETLKLSLYKMKDPSGAYGEYSYLRAPDMPRAGAERALRLCRAIMRWCWWEIWCSKCGRELSKDAKISAL